MSKKLAIIGASGKLAFATLTYLLDSGLLPPDQIIATTSSESPSSPQWTKLSDLGVTVRHASFDSRSSIETALKGAETLFLVSSPRIAKDFGDVQDGQGREADHFVALEAAAAVGVKHVYYTSLAFKRPSKAGVMRAHISTEKYLEQQLAAKGLGWTVIREGLYNESWPLYFGHWKLGEDERTEIEVAGEGTIPWTSIADLGTATARILTASRKDYAGKTLYLCNRKNRRSLRDIAGLVGKALGKDIAVKVVGREDHEKFYIEKRNMDPGLVRWWVSTYDALRDGECDVTDDTFQRLMAEADRSPTNMEQTVAEMTGASQ
ncbi:NAD(P)-binding protein [Myriangium duriaei CBS 260.36]|uniref:NAD(P)-binding protein n=1 Tax=Myriangium duriaei CBS 260.36 TaxID=1168546 RepID=A0A9P4J677_9PEZI|nr:NAD(P)-binding protein [Myriangium duriaei CBS 260.36]